MKSTTRYYIAFLFIVILVQNVYGQKNALHNKYIIYRNRLLNEWIVISPNVEQFGVNITAVDRKLDSTGTPKWVSWSDGNSNFNHWLGILATEYRLLKDNKQDYTQSLEMLVYSLLAIERLDLYSEYALRHHHGLVDSTQPDIVNIKYPEYINGFLIRDDVTLGFWRQYYKHFNNPKYGWHNESKDGTNRYSSIFQKGVIPKQGMSQDNIIYMLQSLALIKALVDNESISDIRVNFINNYIPRYLNTQGIIKNDSVYFDIWVDDLTDRLVKRMQHPYPEQEIVLKPHKGMARPSKLNFGGIMNSRWYISNPITNDLVAEGNGEDMGVWMNSYGVAEAANFITGKNYHFDNSDSGISAYLFKALLFKDLKFLKFGGFPVPDPVDDYMFRALASVADINWNENSYDLIYLPGDKRKGWTYEHNELILYLIHKEKYSKILKPGTKLYKEDKEYFTELLACAPLSGPSTDYSRPDYHPYWSASSRLNWPAN
ncbi:MAG: hypothetical protein C0596_17235 [Marinilabiliales bacterium]|nr:MAG: hypothetical protein C0596_17235 [Marinilabiliales bacterium]